MSVRYIVGDVFDALAKLPDDSIDLVMTSPPFLALRSYLPVDHPEKAREIGSEATPGEYLDTMLDVVEALDRVLVPAGSLVFELGDTYSGSGGAGGDYGNPDKTNARRDAPLWSGAAAARRNSYAKRYEDPSIPRTGPGRTIAEREGWPLDKSKVLIPELFAIALAYGFNPLTGRETDRWRVRNVVAWCRPNPPVGALGDKFRPATSYLTIACKAWDRYFDSESVRLAGSANTHPRLAERVSRGRGSRPNEGKAAAPERGGNFATLPIMDSDGTAPPLDYWVIPTAPYKGSHYATYPPELCVVPIKSMCPPGGTVLDPFAGSGTTLAVASGHGRNAIGIDLDERNAELARQRVGMWLEIEYPEVEVTHAG